jgi:hypothetical protein
MTERKSLGKRLRFEIFKRDSFTCQYCGKQPPEVVLVIDHINPVASGGDNDPLNLITACEVCNQGKADKQLQNISPRPDADLEWLEMQQEIAELRHYQIAKSERDRLTQKNVRVLQETWAIYFNDENVPADFVLMQWFSWASPEEIEEAIKIASAKSYRLSTFNRRLQYTAGVLHKLTGTNKENSDD